MNKDWELTQSRQIEDIKRGIGELSKVKQNGAMMVGAMLEKLIPGKTCLDVGCGILPLPGYMKHAPSVKFTGVDPMTGGRRDFSFVQCKAEELPFRDREFDAVLFATSIDHIEHPTRAVAECFRVLKPGGYVIVWGSFRNETDQKYIKWKQTRALALYNHPWVFTLRTIDALMIRFEREWTMDIQNSEKILIYKK